ncbi:DNA-binding transcriptional LysR family regulator [Luteibacter sp. Sphag1AF]|uniref:LysR family transcriptional regulator n=1 Tax=Luteibacter sp. Sphag1AF TaxID=2587031 RepID=UPI001607CB52|nr:LysR family transcriptional regulator [Luteibacter sp. Sphag1AF]MBB3226130.1 DNA-binding transcriptional LysR family regulator [Luteibacter sp. Sphag1AF]
MNVTLRQLKAFLAVARQQHFGRAADSIHLTQPAVSRLIADLEAELEVRLFDRTTREVVPTETGRYLEQAVARTLDDLDAVLAHARQQGDPLRGRVRIASVPTLSASIMPLCIARCAGEHPSVEILLRDQNQAQVLEAVRSGEVDFGLAIEPSPDDEFDTHDLLMDPFWLVCPANHPLADSHAVAWKRLRGETLILLDHASGSRRLIDQALATHGIDAHVGIEVGHAQTAFRMVSAGLGITVTPGLSLDGLTPDLAARQLTPVIQRQVVLARRRQRSLSPPAETIWTWLAQRAATILTSD